ncbi:hypothetical protein SGLAM104S_07799 [Streptomyces glaucescens]
MTARRGGPPRPRGGRHARAPGDARLLGLLSGLADTCLRLALTALSVVHGVSRWPGSSTAAPTRSYGLTSEATAA